MLKDFNELITEFKRISKLNWVESVNKANGSVGLTFERELNKKFDSMFFPDYYGTELKCTTRFSRYPITLFSVVFDGPTYPEINRIVNLYGYPDYKYKDRKVLNANINCVQKNKCGNFKYKLLIDHIDEKKYLEVYDLNDNLLEKKSFIYFDSVIARLNLKLKNLAIINASKKNENNKEFFRYYKLNIYHLINSDVFIKMLEEGKIFVTLESRIGKSGINKGKYKNKNLVFKIKKEYLEELFEKEYTLDMDYNIDRITSSVRNNFFIMP